MSFYYQNEEIGKVLRNILNKACHKKYVYQLNNIAVTWINYEENSQKGFGYGINNRKKIYPASLVKLVYALATYSWIENKKIFKDEEVNNAIAQMLYHSSNDATSFIVDLLSGTTSRTSLEGDIYSKWKYKRGIINNWLRDLNWEELKEFNCCQKTWEDSPYGREKDFYGTFNENRNAMTTDGTARIMEEIMKNLKYHENNINIKICLHRSLNQKSLKKDPNNQIEGFLGEGLPKDKYIWSKAGLMSEVRHDAAWWINRNKSKTLLVVFTQGQEFAQDNLFLPKISKAIYKYLDKDFIDHL